MRGTVAKKLRQEVRRRMRFDVDGFVGEVMDLSFNERWNFCWRVLFKIGRKEKSWLKRTWKRIMRKKTGR